MKIRFNPFLATLAVIAITQSAAMANSYWWDTLTTGTWATAGNWWTTAGGTVAGVAPGAADLVTFNGTGVNGPEIVQLGAATSVSGMTFANTGTTTIKSSSTTTQTLTIGTPGITVNSGAGIVTIGDGTNKANLILGLDATTASYSFANNNTVAANTLVIMGGITGGTTGSAGAKTLNVSSAGGGITLSGVITNGGATSLALNLTASNAAGITLNGGSGSTYSGGTTIGNKVTLSVTSAGSLGSGLVTVASGGQLMLYPAGTVSNNLNISGVGTSTNGALRMGSGTNTINGNITLAADSTIGVDSGRTATINGNISGAFNLTKVSTAAGLGSPLTLAGINSNSGTTTVTQGALSFAKQSSLYNSTTSSWVPSKITVASGTGLALGVGDSASGYWDATAVTTFLGATQMGASTTTAGFKAGSFFGFDTTNATAGTFTYGAIGNIGTSTTNGVVKLGTGTLVLNGTNTYSGGTDVEAGTLNLASTGVISGTTLAVGTTSTTIFSNNGGSATFSGALTLGTGSYSQSSGTSSVSGVSTSGSSDSGLISITGGNFTVTNDMSLARTSFNTSGTAPTLAAPLVAATTTGLYVNGASAVVKPGTLSVGTANSNASALVNAGSLEVTGAVTVGKNSGATNRYSVLQVSGGTFTAADTTNGVVIAPNGATNTVASVAEVYLTGGTTTAGKIAFGASGDAVSGTGFLILGGGTLYVGSGGIVKASTTTGANLYSYTIGLTSGTLGAAADWSSSLNMTLGANPTIKTADSTDTAHNITMSGILSGTGVTKTGSGTLTLSGNSNSYTGATSVDAGTLVLNGNISTSSLTTVASTATLAGTGTVGAATINGILAIGGTTGTMSFAGDLGLNSGSISNFDISGFDLGTYDLAKAAIAGTQTVNFNGGTLNLLFQSGFSTTGSVKIFDFDSYAGTGFTSVVVFPNLAAGYSASFDATNGIVTVVPEPDTTALLGGLGVFALLRRRRD